jgi:hypothetical protein
MEELQDIMLSEIYPTQKDNTLSYVGAKNVSAEIMLVEARKGEEGR